MASIEDTVAQYLDGDLSPEAKNRFEGDLVNDEVAQALSVELYIREFLKQLPPDMPPEGLIDATVDLILAEIERSDPDSQEIATWKQALAGAGWMWRGPALALEPSMTGALSSLSGLPSMGYTLGSLQIRSKKKPESVDKPTPSRTWWRRALRILR